MTDLIDYCRRSTTYLHAWGAKLMYPTRGKRWRNAVHKTEFLVVRLAAGQKADGAPSRPRMKDEPSMSATGSSGWDSRFETPYGQHLLQHCLDSSPDLISVSLVLSFDGHVRTTQDRCRMTRLSTLAGVYFSASISSSLCPLMAG